MSELENNLEDVIINNTNQINILVYCLKYSIDNNKILVLSDKINEEKLHNENLQNEKLLYKSFEIVYKTYIIDELTLNNELLTNQYGFVFTEKKNI